jgi:very-short-patch-repair endonuclease
MPKSSARIRGTTPEIEAAAIELRKKLTPSEKQLWQALRGGKLGGFKFRRQHPVGRFILDFYCPVCKLVIELDGAIHDTALPAVMQYSFLLTPLLSSLSAFRMYLIAAGSAVIRQTMMQTEQNI